MSGWDDLHKDDFWRRWSNRPAFEITKDWISTLRRIGAKRVYDMGCGLGRHTLLLAEHGFSVVASDISSRALEFTRQKLEAAKVEAEVVCADMTVIPFRDEYFDVILSAGVMEHNTRRGIKKLILEVSRTLRPGGRILASFLPRGRWISKDGAELDMLEDNTLRCYGPEDTIHHMVDEAELNELFSKFAIHSIDTQVEVFAGCESQELFISEETPK